MRMAVLVFEKVYERLRLKTPSLPSTPGTDGGETPGRCAAGMKADLPKAGKEICCIERLTKNGPYL